MFYRRKKLRLPLMVNKTTAALTPTVETLMEVMLVKTAAVTSQHAFLMMRKPQAATQSQSLIPLVTTSVYSSSTGKAT